MHGKYALCLKNTLISVIAVLCLVCGGIASELRIEENSRIETRTDIVCRRKTETEETEEIRKERKKEKKRRRYFLGKFLYKICPHDSPRLPFLPITHTLENINKPLRA